MMMIPCVCKGGPADGTRVSVDSRLPYINIAVTPEFSYDPDEPIQYMPTSLCCTYGRTRKLDERGLVIYEYKP